MIAKRCIGRADMQIDASLYVFARRNAKSERIGQAVERLGEDSVTKADDDAMLISSI
jgi:hypothetical protein